MLWPISGLTEHTALSATMLIHFPSKGLVVFFLVNCTDSVLLNESEAINVGCPEWKYHSQLETVQSVSLNAIMSTAFRPRAHISISQRVKVDGLDSYDCLSWSVQSFLKTTSWFLGQKIKATNSGCICWFLPLKREAPQLFPVSAGWPWVSLVSKNISTFLIVYNNNQWYLRPYFTISASRCGNKQCTLMLIWVSS